MRTCPIRSSIAFCALASCALAPWAWPSSARAQDTAQPEPAATTASDPARAAALLARLDALYPVALQEPAPVDMSRAGDAKAIAQERARHQRETKSWLSALDRLPEMSRDYRAAAGAGASAKAWFDAGFARVRRASKAGAAPGRELLTTGAEELRTYLAAAPRDAAFRTDAERLLAYADLRLAGGDAEAIVAAAPHADAAVRALLAAGRSDDAGASAYLILKSLIFADHEADAAALASGWDAGSADFGRSTESVRRLVRRARVRVGEQMPALPELASCTGAPMPWGSLAGKPYVLHFFNTTVSSTAREVETILVPLRDEWGAKGLRIVGCSTDREMTDEEIERTRANWEEWGKKDVLRDGRVTSVREWAEQRGMDWPWYWDGRWTKNVLVQSLGVEINAPFAILVDADGIIRWRGQPFQGLAEAARALLR